MAFVFPPMHDFKPMYTKQPNAESWARQSQLWCEIILDYCRHNRIHRLDLNEALASPLFRNAKINRALSRELAVELINLLVKQGNAEWEPNQREKTRCSIIWRTPSQWAEIIHSYVQEQGQTNTVLTVYELLNTMEDAPFHRLDQTVFFSAVEVLQRNKKAVLLQGDTSDEQGLKFF